MGYIDDLLAVREKHVKAIEAIDRKLEKSPEVFFEQKIKGKCFIVKGHGHFVDDNIWWLYKPSKIEVDEVFHSGFDIICDDAYETYDVEVGGRDFCFSDHEAKITITRYFRFSYSSIHEAFREKFEEVSEEEFWERLNKETGIKVTDLKKFDIEGVKTYRTYEQYQRD